MDIKKVQKFEGEQKREIGANIFGLVANLFKGIGNIFSSAIQMEKEGLKEYLIARQIEGTTRRGKKLKIQYGIRTRIGLDNFINRDKSK